MTTPEVQKLFAFLQALYPRAAAFRDKNVFAAWRLVLEPYGYEAVRGNLIDHSRRCNFPPDVGELTRGLPAPRRSGGSKAWIRQYTAD